LSCLVPVAELYLVLYLLLLECNEVAGHELCAASGLQASASATVALEVTFCMLMLAALMNQPCKLSCCCFIICLVFGMVEGLFVLGCRRAEFAPAISFAVFVSMAAQTAAAAFRELTYYGAVQAQSL
jgi:hypothetical protein